MGGSLYIEGIVFVEAELVEVCRTGAVVVRDSHPLRNAAFAQRSSTRTIREFSLYIQSEGLTLLRDRVAVHRTQETC